MSLPVLCYCTTQPKYILGHGYLQNAFRLGFRYYFQNQNIPIYEIIQEPNTFFLKF